MGKGNERGRGGSAFSSRVTDLPANRMRGSFSSLYTHKYVLCFWWSALVSCFEVFLAWVFNIFLSYELYSYDILSPFGSYTTLFLYYSLSTVCVECGICSSYFLVARHVSSIL